MTDSKEWCDGDWRCRSSSKPFAGAESGSPGRALEAGKRGSPGRAVQAGIRGKRLKGLKFCLGDIPFSALFYGCVTSWETDISRSDISRKRTNYKRTSLPLVPVAPPGGYNIITIDDVISARWHARRHSHAQSIRCKWRRSCCVCLVVRTLCVTELKWESVLSIRLG